MTTETAACVLPPMLTLFKLRRVMGSTMNVWKNKIRIGGDVTLYKIYNVKSKMNDRQHAAYTKIHDNYTDAFDLPKKDKKDVWMLSTSHSSPC